MRTIACGCPGHSGVTSESRPLALIIHHRDVGPSCCGMKCRRKFPKYMFRSHPVRRPRSVNAGGMLFAVRNATDNVSFVAARSAAKKNMEYVFLAGGRKGRRRIFN